MGDKTGIQWTDATWNAIVGCSVTSPGCTNCYAMAQAARIERMTPGSHYSGTTKNTKAGAVWTGRLRDAPYRTLTQPIRWAKPRRVFVNSMSDLFHEAVADQQIDRIFAVMSLTPRHTYQVLTKRPARMREYLTGDCWPRIEVAARVLVRDGEHAPVPPGRTLIGPLPNVWLGVSVEDRVREAERIPALLATPAAVRFVSAEPLLGALDLCEALGIWWSESRGWVRSDDPARVDWIIVGGESGPGARPFGVGWARQIVEKCGAAKVACFVKQVGAAPFFGSPGHVAKLRDRKGGDPEEWPVDLRVREMPR